MQTIFMWSKWHFKIVHSFVILCLLCVFIRGYQARLPFLLVLGVATAVSAVHRSLPHHVSSCLRMKVFHSQPSLTYLNEVLEKVQNRKKKYKKTFLNLYLFFERKHLTFCFLLQVFFLPERPFHLGGKAFKLLLDVFLFHDFSVMGFVQGYKVSKLSFFCITILV